MIDFKHLKSKADLYWLVGILEGEGSFGFYKNSPIIQMQLTDVDVITRAAKILGVNVHAPWKPRGKDTYKPVWSLRVHGVRAVEWMRTILALMGKRRQEKIIEVIMAWKAAPGFPKAPRGKRMAARCHPDQEVCGWGLCKPCYMRQWRANRKSI